MVHTGQEKTRGSRSESVALGHHVDRRSSMLQDLYEYSGTSSQTYIKLIFQQWISLPG